MSVFWQKIKGSWINSLIFSCFLLVIFLILFYLSNLDIKPKAEKISQDVSISNADNNLELKNRMGSSSMAFLSYDEWANQYNLGQGTAKYDGDPDNDGLPNFLEYAHGTDPLKADTDNDGYSDKQEITNGYDPDAAQGNPKLIVSLRIDKLGITAPMIWSTSENEKDMLTDLENGISHYAKTAAPGQKGNAIISGHSSNYIWAKGDYNHIFKDLNNLENGDIVSVKTVQKNGRIIIYQYKITDKFITSADDERIFADTAAPTLTLSTCWPLGTNFKRIIVKAELVQ